jgi:hypothetical protein
MSEMKAVVSSSFYAKESKKGDMMLVAEHECEGMEWPVREYVLLNHKGFARRKAQAWWQDRAAGNPPETVDEALSRLHDIKPIEALLQEKDGDFWVVKEVQFQISNVEQTKIEDDESEYF